MKKRIGGAAWALLGLVVAVPGVVSAVHTIQKLPPLHENHIGGTGIVAQVRYYDLRWEILLVVLGVICLLTSLVLFLSPRRIRVAVTELQTEADTASLAAGGRDEPSVVPAVPAVECYLRTRLLGTTFANPDGSSRQSLLAGTSVGDVLICRTLGKRQNIESVGVFTIKGRQLGYMDTSFVRTIREQYPNRRIGVCVERIHGGQGLPYTCDLRVVIFHR